MELRADVHLSADVLQAFGLGKLDDTTADIVANHLEICSTCRQQAAAMSSDDFLDRLRAAHSRGGTPAPGKPLSGIPQTRGDAASLAPTPLHVPGLPPELVNHPQYEIVRELGRGGMGVVYLARNKLLARLEVLKVVNKAILEQNGVAERFLREIQSAAHLNHPNVVTAYSALPLGGSLAFAMEYVEGEDLAKLMKARGSLPVAYACYCVRQAALGLQHAHEKHMVHRDIKPQNLILARDSAKHIVKVLDFGLAKVLQEGGNQRELTASGMMMGTPDYMAPEQSVDAATADIRADIYSLGCTLYYLLAGEPPFKGGSLYAILHAHQSVEAKALNLVRAEVPAELADVVRKMMAKAPEQRYQTPGEVARAFAPFIKQTTKEASGGPSLFQQPTVIGKHGAKPEAPAGKGAPAAGVDTFTSGGSTSAEMRTAREARKTQLSTKPLTKKKWLIGGAAAGVALLTFMVLTGLVGLWANGVLKVKTKDGTIVLENLPPDADVTVDNGTVSVTSSDGKTFEVRVDASKKKHRVEVKKDGFKAFGEEVEIDAGGRKTVVVKLEPKERPPDAPKPPPAPPNDNGLDELLTRGSVWKGRYVFKATKAEGVSELYVQDRGGRTFSGLLVSRDDAHKPDRWIWPVVGTVGEGIMNFHRRSPEDQFHVTATLKRQNLSMVWTGADEAVGEIVLQKEAEKPESARVVFSVFEKDNTDGWYTLNSDGTKNATERIRVDTFNGYYWLFAQPLRNPKEFGWHAPAKYHGDHSGKFGRCLIYSLLAKNGHPPVTDWYARLVGAGMTLYLDGTILDPPENSQWKTYCVRLDASAGWKTFPGGNRATDAEIKNVLSQLTDLRIKGEFATKTPGCLAGVEFGADDPFAKGQK
jgi:serine/threonine protein kinase